MIEADGTLVGVETAMANRLVEDAPAARAIAPRSGDARRRRELAARVAIGERAVMIYVVRRGDRTSSGLAGDIDPAYTDVCFEAHAAGVEMVAFGCRVGLDGTAIAAPVPIDLEA